MMKRGNGLRLSMSMSMRNLKKIFQFITLPKSEMLFLKLLEGSDGVATCMN